MRLLFSILLLSCAGFFAFMQWGGSLAGANKNDQLLGDLNADKIKLLVASPVKPAPAANTPPVPQMVAVSAPVSATPVIDIANTATVAVSAPVVAPVQLPVKVQAGKVGTAKICMEWGEFSGTDLALASKALTDMKLKDTLQQRTVEYEKGFWVYIPPLKNKAAVNKKIGILKAAGIAEYFVVQDFSQWHNAISLGVFKTEAAATLYETKLKKKGLLATRVGPRKSKLKFTIFVLKRIDAVTASKLALLQKDFVSSELKTIPCSN